MTTRYTFVTQDENGDPLDDPCIEPYLEGEFVKHEDFVNLETELEKVHFALEKSRTLIDIQQEELEKWKRGYYPRGRDRGRGSCT